MTPIVGHLKSTFQFFLFTLYIKIFFFFSFTFRPLTIRRILPLSLSELTPMIFSMWLSHLGLEASNVYQILKLNANEPIKYI